MPPEQVVWLVGATLLGACVGSFVNVLIFRLPRDRSVVAPGSHCFCCGTPLRVLDLVPLVSFLAAGRRCRYCGVALSGQYLWIEFACALLYFGLALRWGPSLPFAAYAAAAAALLAAFMTDVHFKIIPTQLNLTIGVAGLLAALAAWLLPGLPGAGRLLLVSRWGTAEPVMALAGALLGYLVFELIVRLGRWLFGQEAMGGGDVLLAAAVGALTGPTRAFTAFFIIGIFTGALVGVLLLATRRLSRRDPMAFGPYLVVGALTVFLWPQVADVVGGWYGLGPPSTLAGVVE